MRERVPDGIALLMVVGILSLLVLLGVTFTVVQRAERDVARAMAALERQLTASHPDQPHPTAQFTCVLALAWPDGHVESFTGEVHGHLCFPPRGHRGFGYDPMFVADGHDITFAELEPTAKHAISHRAVAFGKLAAACLNSKP